MGNIIHDCLVVTSWNRDLILKARRIARKCGLRDLMSEISKSRVNGYSSFCIFSCGSKNYWEEVEIFTEQLHSLKGKLSEHKSLEWVHVCYGNDLQDYDCVVDKQEYS